MHFHDFALVLMAFICEFLGTISGFGSSTFFVPSALLIEVFKLVLVLTAILHCFGNIFKIILFRMHFKKRQFFLLAIPSMLFTGLGAITVNHVATQLIGEILGIVLILVSLTSLFKKMQLHTHPWMAVPMCGLSGFFTGLVGTGGAIRGLALTMMKIEKNAFVSISASIDMGGDLIRTLIYIENGFMDWNQWFYIPLLGIAAMAGAMIGKKFLSLINQSQFDKIVAVFIGLSGLLMLIS